MRADEELEAEQNKLLEERALIEKERLDTRNALDEIEAELRFYELLKNILKVSEHETP